MNKRISENGIDAVGCYSFKFFEVQSSTRFALTEALSLAVASHAVRVAHSTHGYVKSRSERKRAINYREALLIIGCAAQFNG